MVKHHFRIAKGFSQQSGSKQKVGRIAYLHNIDFAQIKPRQMQTFKEKGGHIFQRISANMACLNR